ncbi:MAG: superoxide dismutase family protein [Thermoanaerobaculia bacterium]
MNKLLVSVTAILMLAGCATTAPGLTAAADLDAKSGSNVDGTVRFEEILVGGIPAVRVTVDATGVPAGTHGFHIHQVGDCSAPDASSAGDHFNPGGERHGSRGSAQRHAGDFGNVEANANGAVSSSFVINGVTVGAGSSSVVGRAIVLHAQRDDLTSQPSGNAGARIACGVIRPATM